MVALRAGVRIEDGDSSYGSGPAGVVVASGATLTVPAGFVVKAGVNSTQGCGGECRLTVDGTLVTQGTATSPVVFTLFLDDSYGGDTNGDRGDHQPSTGDWAGIVLYGGGSQLNGAVVAYADTGVSIYAGGEAVTNSTIRNSSGDGLDVRFRTAWSRRR